MTQQPRIKLYKSLYFEALFIFTIMISGSDASAQALSMNDSFEKAAYIKGWDREEKCCNYSVRQTDSIAYTGKYSIRFEVNKSDKMVANGRRAEIAFKTEKYSKIDRWFSFSIFVPGDYEKDITSDILAQWHESPDFNLGEDYRTAPIALKTQDDHWRAAIQWSPDQVNTDKSIAGKKLFDLGKISKNKWTNWVWHIRFSCYDDGLVEIWKDGNSILNYSGPNYYNDVKGPFFKFGIYKPDWKVAATKSTVNKRVVFFDDVMVGDEKTNLQMIRSLTPNK